MPAKSPPDQMGWWAMWRTTLDGNFQPHAWPSGPVEFAMSKGRLDQDLAVLACKAVEACVAQVSGLVHLESHGWNYALPSGENTTIVGGQLRQHS